MSVLGTSHHAIAPVFVFAPALLLALACGPDAASPTSAQGDAKTSKSDADPSVGYDIRRLRPRNEEPLDAMFDRLRTKAVVDDGKRVAVLFSADWCEPCRKLDAELGNTHPRSAIGDVRILEMKEEDWQSVTRMDEFNNLRKRWYPKAGSYPVLVLLDDKGEKLEEMKEAIARLEQSGTEPTLPNWFESTRPG